VECFLVHPPHQGLRGTRAPSASGQGRALSFPECLKSFYNGWSCVLFCCVVLCCFAGAGGFRGLWKLNPRPHSC
jgi:hypothetical protein